MSDPLISVLTPTFNGASFLPWALGSTAHAVQTRRVEHVVVDGGSSDGTVDLLAEYDVVWRSEPDRGQSDALNKAFALSRGEWIGWLNCDEYYLPGVLEALYAFVDSPDSDSVDLIYGDYIEVDAHDRVLRLVTQHAMNAGILRRFGFALPSSTVVVRRAAVSRAGGWNVDTRTVMDWELWLRLLQTGARFHYTGRAHTAFTRHDEQASARLAERVVVETAALQKEFGIKSGRVRDIAARLARITRKTFNGAYLRQWRFARDLAANRELHDAELLREPAERSPLVARYALR